MASWCNWGSFLWSFLFFLFFCSFAWGGGDDGERGWQALHGERKQLRGLGYSLIVSVHRAQSLLMIGDAFRGVKNMFRVQSFWLSGCLSPSTVQSFTLSRSCLFPGWLCLTPSQTPTLSSTSLSLSIVFLSVCRALTRLWVFPLTLACLAHLLGPSADLHFLRLCLILYSIHSHPSLSIPTIQFPSCSSFCSLLLLLKGFPHLFWSPFIISYCCPFFL